MALVHVLAAAHDFCNWFDWSRQNIRPHANVRSALWYDRRHELCLVYCWHRVCASLGGHESGVRGVLPQLRQNFTAGR